MAMFERFGTAERTPAEVRGMLERKETLYGFDHRSTARTTPARSC